YDGLATAPRSRTNIGHGRVSSGQALHLNLAFSWSTSTCPHTHRSSFIAHPPERCTVAQLPDNPQISGNGTKWSIVLMGTRKVRAVGKRLAKAIFRRRPTSTLIYCAGEGLFS